MPKYENSIIYKLKHNEDYDEINIYIGSTTNFKHRKNQHKNACNKANLKFYNMSLYKFIRENGGWNEWVMIPIEEYGCNSKNELEMRERYHIDLLRPVLNKVIPTRTHKEYYQDNKEIIAKKKKNHYENNKEKIAEKRKEYYQDNKEKRPQYDKQRYENNKDKINEYNKEYYSSNKEKIIQQLSITITCPNCGCEITKGSLKRHQQSNKCLTFFKKD